MSLPIIMLLSICTILTMLTMLSRVFTFRTLVRNAIYVDIIFTVMCFIVFAGTLGGTLVAVMSGLFMSLTLTSAKHYYNWAYTKGYTSQPLVPAKVDKNKETLHQRMQRFRQTGEA